MPLRAFSHPGEERLRALVLGAAADDTAARHLAHCPRCQAEVKLLRHVRRASAAGAGGSCPPPQDIARLAYALEESNPGRVALEDHVAGCLDCVLLLEGLGRADQASGPEPVRRPDRVGLARRLRKLVEFEMPPSLA